MPSNREVLGIIEDGALQPPVVQQKAAWLDQIDLDPEAGGKTKQGPGILWYVRLVQGEAQQPPTRLARAEQYRHYRRNRLILRQSVA